MKSTVKVHCTLRFDKLSVLLTEKLRGKNITDNTVIQRIDLHADTDWIYAALQVAGNRNGVVVSQFRIVSAPETSAFRIEGLKVHIEAPGFLARGANFLMKHLFGDRIESAVQHKIDSTLAEVISSMTSQFESLEMKEGFVLRSLLEDYNFDHVSWDTDALICKLSAKGEIAVELA